MTKVNCKDLVIGNDYFIDAACDIAGEFIKREKGSIYFKINWRKEEDYDGGYFLNDNILELSDFEEYKFNEKA